MAIFQTPSLLQRVKLFILTCLFRAQEEVRNRIGIRPPYDRHVAGTSFYNYQRLLNLTQWDIWGKTFRKMLVNMSQEYMRCVLQRN